MSHGYLGITMMQYSFVIIFLTVVTGTLGFQKWDGLRVTWCFNLTSDPEHCNLKVPRTVGEASSSGWHELITPGGCNNQGKFNGRRFVKGDNLALSPLYDVNGIIAGIQMNLVKDELFASSNPFQYDKVPDYLDNEIAGRPAYSLTYYYVNPNRICSGGRTERDLEKEGTGNSFWIQAGPNTHSHNLVRVPLYKDAAIKENWSDNLCVPTMGHHTYYDAPNMSKFGCTIMRPSFLMFNNAGELIGYGGTAVGNLSSPSFEHPDTRAVLSGLGTMAPQCMLNFTYNPGYSNVHMHLIDQPRVVTCQPLVQVEHTGDVYVSPNAQVKGGQSSPRQLFYVESQHKVVQTGENNFFHSKSIDFHVKSAINKKCTPPNCKLTK